jgi:hypothetical protein
LITNVQASRQATCFGKKLAIAWDWRSLGKDGNRAVSHDPIIVDLLDGKIASSREHCDLADEFRHTRLRNRMLRGNKDDALEG